MAERSPPFIPLFFLENTSLAQFSWGETLRTAMYILNRVPIKLF